MSRRYFIPFNVVKTKELNWPEIHAVCIVEELDSGEGCSIQNLIEWDINPQDSEESLENAVTKLIAKGWLVTLSSGNISVAEDKKMLWE